MAYNPLIVKCWKEVGATVRQKSGGEFFCIVQIYRIITDGIYLIIPTDARCSHLGEIVASYKTDLAAHPCSDRR